MKAGLAVGLYYSPEDFKFLYDHKILIKRGDNHFDKNITAAYDDLVRKQTIELFTMFGKIDVLFIDGEPKGPCRETAWKLQPDVVIARGAVNTPEQTLPGIALNEFWESCVTMGTQWNYKPTNDNIKTAGRLIELLVEARAKGGNFLLNVGPHPDGYIPYEQETPLQLYFEYRPYAGFAENLYSKDWLRTSSVSVSDQGRFMQLLPAVEGGKEYQYRAVIVHPRLTVRGDVKRIMVKLK